MKTKSLGLIALITLLGTMLLTGCMTANPDDQTVPWAVSYTHLRAHET